MIVKDGLIVPKFGALFTSTEGTSPLSVIDDFTLLSGPAGWQHWGHLSRENLPETSSEGGETSALSTWLEMNTDSETEESVDSVVYSLLQRDAGTIAAMTAVNGAKTSALELWMSGTRRFGIWYPSLKMALSGRPTPNGTDQYSESKLTGTILKPSSSISSLHDPENGLSCWPNITSPDSLYIDSSAFGAGSGAPAIAAAVPTGLTSGDALVLTGLRFAGTTGITIDGQTVVNYDVISPTMISLVIPATVAGAANIVVTNAAGASAAYPYTAA